jgi:hypothetical protein
MLLVLSRSVLSCLLWSRLAPFLSVPSCLVPSRPVSGLVLSCLAFRPVPSCPVSSLVLSCLSSLPVLSCPVLSHLVPSRLALSRSVPFCPVSSLVLSCLSSRLVPSRLVLSHPVPSRRVLQNFHRISNVRESRRGDRIIVNNQSWFMEGGCDVVSWI